MRAKPRSMRSLHDSWQLGGITIPNRVVLAPLAGIGNWFVRLQAKRYGAGFAVSEMVSSFAIHYGNRKTHDELLTIDPRERDGGPVAIQLFGHDPEIMRSRRGPRRPVGRRHHRPQHGLPGAQGDEDGRRRGAAPGPRHGGRDRDGGARGLGPAGHREAARGQEGVEARRSGWSRTPASRASRSTRARVKVRHKGTPDYDLAAQLVQELPVPVIVTGGMDGPDHVRWVFEHTGCEAVMLARGSLGNPWLFEQVLGRRDGEPSREEILEEWAWVVDRGEEHLGADRAGALPAQVPPVVPRAAGRAARPCRTACSAPRRSPSSARSSPNSVLPCSAALLSEHSSRPPGAGVFFLRIPPQGRRYAEGRHPHP